MTLDILFEDENILAINKSNKIATEGDQLGSETLFDLVKKEYGEVYLLNRLDFGVGGIVLFAKNKGAAGFLSKQIQDHDTFEKYYYAIVSGTPKDEETLTDYLYQDKRAHKAVVSKKGMLSAKEAKLSYTKVQTKGEYSLLIIRLYTGRFHQIRCQLAAHKMPILGDKKYGSKQNGEIALFSTKVVFTNPKSGLKEEIVCKPTPSVFSDWNV